MFKQLIKLPVRKLKSYFQLLKHWTILSENLKWKDIHKGRRCFVIGNGPSLKNQDLSLLRNEITFVMNAFWKHPIISDEWQPTYYCFADPITFDGSEPFQKFFKSLNEKINKSFFFVPTYAKEIIEKQNLLPIDRTHYVCFSEALWEDNFRRIDLTKIIPSPQSTSQLAIEAALYMGCNPIYLLGLDHDWLAHRGEDRHFYSGKTVDNHPEVHGDLSKYSYREELEACLNLWKRYEKLLDYANRNGVKIFNATAGGFLDVFERVRYEEIVGNRL